MSVGELTKYVVTELGMLQAERTELFLGLGPECVATRGPEVGDRRSYRRVVLAGVGIDIASVSNLALGRGINTMDLARGQLLQLVYTEFLGQGVCSRVLQQLVTRLVNIWN